MNFNNKKYGNKEKSIMQIGMQFFHLVKAMNLPFMLPDIEEVSLIKAIQPWKRFSIDHKGPVTPGVDTGSRSLRTVMDEYGYFPWAFSCGDHSVETVIECLT